MHLCEFLSFYIILTNKKISKLLLLFCILMIFLTFSRGVYVALLFVSLVYLSKKGNN